MRRKHTYFLIILLSIIACEKYTFELEMADPNKEYSFSKDIQPIFDAKCIDCHKGSLNPDLRSGNSYSSLTDEGYISNPKQAESTELYKKLEGSHNEKATDIEKQIITYWLQQGAKNN